MHTLQYSKLKVLDVTMKILLISKMPKDEDDT